YQDLAPVVIPPPTAARLYLNGEPWGIYMLKVRVNADFIEEETGHSDIDLIKNLEDISAGSDQHWRETLAFFAAANFAQEADLTEAEERVDVQWMAEYALINGWASNHDWPFNNSYVYREQGGAVPWTWIPWDTDACWGSDSGKPFEYDGISLMHDIEPLDDLSDGSPAYRTQIARTWARMRNDMAAPDNLHSLVDMRAAELRDDIAFETDRWGSSPEAWELNIDRMHSYVDERDDIFWRQVAQGFAPHSGGWLSVEIDGEGAVAVEELNVADGWTGRFFGDMPLQLVATPAEGWRFEQWSGAVDASDSTTTMSIDGDTALVATFVEE
ncbi:MAG: hypothetical protein ACI8RZ_001582, partial [Myxococcota bacterium]